MGEVLERDTEWTSEQLAVINADPQARLLVDAGPGAGKTTVACGRIIRLLREGTCDPRGIVVISFTRAAVGEFRTRIQKALEDANTASLVEITTLDSLFNRLSSGFGEDVSGKTFDENIDVFAQALLTNPQLQEYVQGIEHLVVDEAQDIVGKRRLAVADLISCLEPTAGVTVFSDSAQAIYGFSESEAPSTEPVETLPETIARHMTDFGELELTEVHRTSSTELLEIFSRGRRLLRKSSASPRETHDDLRHLIEERASETEGDPRQPELGALAGNDNAVILFRNRGDALDFAARLGHENCHLRLTNQPTPLPAWIGIIFSTFTESEMGQEEFLKRWDKFILQGTLDDALANWSHLVRIAGVSQTRIRTQKLAQELSKTSFPGWPGAPKVGLGGPAVGTIHSFKGREAEVVRLFMHEPNFNDETLDHQVDEETRVMFVGATRARMNLEVKFLGTVSKSGRLASGRAFKYNGISRKYRQTNANIEVGHLDDLFPEDLVGKTRFGSKSEAAEAQAQVVSLSRSIGLTNLRAEKIKVGDEWPYRIFAEDAGTSPLGYLSKAFSRDMADLSRKVTQSPATTRTFKHFSAVGCQTLAVPDDTATRARLHEPWSKSGFVLAPILVGYPVVFFPDRRA
jgi:hypothetical protein